MVFYIRSTYELFAPFPKPWDLAFIGAKLKSFEIPGCDVVSKSVIIHHGI